MTKKPKQKPVYVWITVDDNLYSKDISMFTAKPIKSDDPHGVTFDGYVDLIKLPKKLNIKAGECRKFKLVEVKD